MSTKLRDFPNNAVVLASAQSAAATTGNTAGTSGDFLNGDGRCTLVQTFAGTAANTGAQLQGKVQESTDGTTWTDIAAATLAAGGTTNAVSSVSFDRTARYLRHYSTTTITSGASLLFTAIIFEQLKQVST